MTEQELLMRKYITELSSYMGLVVDNVNEGKGVRDAIEVLSTQLCLSIGRRTIKESKK